MEVLLWIIGIPMAIYWFFRLFGRQLTKLAMRKVIKTLEKEAKRQSEQFQRSYDEGQGEQNVYVDEDLKVTTRRQGAPKDVNEDEIVEDVDFEELKHR